MPVGLAVLVRSQSLDRLDADPARHGEGHDPEKSGRVERRRGSRRRDSVQAQKETQRLIWSLRRALPRKGSDIASGECLTAGTIRVRHRRRRRAADSAAEKSCEHHNGGDAHHGMVAGGDGLGNDGTDATQLADACEATPVLERQFRQAGASFDLVEGLLDAGCRLERRRFGRLAGRCRGVEVSAVVVGRLGA